MVRQSLEDRLRELETLRDAEPQVARQALKRVMAQKNNFMVARAAEIIKEREFEALYPALEQAFFRFMEKPDVTDKNCRAKTAIAKVLIAAEYWSENLYLAGIRHVQLEPVWGGVKYGWPPPRPWETRAIAPALLF